MITDFIGRSFGSLTVIRRHGPTRSSQWACLCVCGKEVVCRTHNLRRKNGSTCRCESRARAKRHATTHDKSSSKEYASWTDMITRCTNPKARSYSRYGGRGIIICPEWRDFEAFFRDMGEAPSPDHTIGRIDNDGPYSQQNCRWETRLEQAMNKSNTRTLEFGGIISPMSEWARRTGIPVSTLERRLNKLRWPVSRALTEPVRAWGPGRPRGVG